METNKGKVYNSDSITRSNDVQKLHQRKKVAVKADKLRTKNCNKFDVIKMKVAKKYLRKKVK